MSLVPISILQWSRYTCWYCEGVNSSVGYEVTKVVESWDEESGGRLEQHLAHPSQRGGLMEQRLESRGRQGVALYMPIGNCGGALLRSKTEDQEPKVKGPRG